jgi:hypothetical protein
LDVNLGCPVYKVTKTGAGSAWLKHPEELYTYMRSIVVASHKPVSAKIRLGWDEKSINFKEVASLLEKAGISLLTIHARTSKQQYTGEADYSLLKGFWEEPFDPPLRLGRHLHPRESDGSDERDFGFVRHGRSRRVGQSASHHEY